MNKQLAIYGMFLAGAPLFNRILPAKLRLPFMLLASWLFYSLLEPKAMPMLVLLSVLTYFIAIRIEASENKKKLFLALGLAITLGSLTVIKILGFFSGAWSVLGFSFYSLAAAGYLIDVYKAKAPAEKNYLKAALFISFYPAVLSGPIERSGNLLAQLAEPKTASSEDAEAGITRILSGLFKKLVIAEQLSMITAPAFSAPYNYTGVQLLFAAFCYSIQIYCDFASYSDLAVGGARLLGIRLIENFNKPYFARTVQDFWRRWHISLSTWFRDYLYFPLGGSRSGKTRTLVNLMIVFIVSGFWHGSDLSFIVWGALHGAFQIAGKLSSPARKNVRARLGIKEDAPVLAFLQICINFCFITFAWIFFRAENTLSALVYIKRIAFDFGDPLHPYITQLGPDSLTIKALLLFIVLLFAFEALSLKGSLTEKLRKNPFILWTAWIVLIIVILIFGAYGPGYNPADFVYFKF